jgi:hypothetical protein
MGVCSERPKGILLPSGILKLAIRQSRVIQTISRSIGIKMRGALVEYDSLHRKHCV